MDVADRYKLLDKIGSGSFATVYRAEDQELGREVAVKQIHPEFLSDGGQTERYWREAALLASFQHPHIVTIFDVVRERGWLILELMQANLRDRLQGRPMDLKAVQATVSQVLRALAALHSRGMVHGDVKPSNLMIDHRKRIKLGDFGLARRVSHDEGSVIRGTAKYMAPETLSQEFGEVGPQCDLYSLGFTAYELMCGARFDSLFPGLDAFGRDRQAAWMMWHAAPDRTLPEISRAMTNVPPPLARVIARLIEKDPKKRYRTAEQALAELGGATDVSTSGPYTSLPSAAETKAPRSRRWLAIGAFVASMAMSSLMLLWSPQSPPTVAPPDKPIIGMIRRVDPDGRTLEYEDPVTGQPEELTLPDKPRIRLIGDGERDEFILPRKLQAGDWIRLESGRDRWQLDVSRPHVSEGRVESVDAAGSRVAIQIDQQRVRGSVKMRVPPRAVIELNGQNAGLRDLAAGDRVSVEHVLDPAGQAGRIVSRIAALRPRQVSGQLVDAAAENATVTLAVGDAAPESFPVAREVRMVFLDGSPAAWNDLVPGRRLRLTADSTVRGMTLFPEPAAAGLLAGVSDSEPALTVESTDGPPVEFAVPDNAIIRINGIVAGLSDLRPQVDRVIVDASSDAGGVPTATVIDASRPARHDRSMIVIANGANRSGTVPFLATTAEDARLVQSLAVTVYATPPERATSLVDRTREEITRDIPSRLAGLRSGTQAIVLVEGTVFFSEGKAMLAGSDFEMERTDATGLPLNDIVSWLRGSPSQKKMLLLNVALRPHEGEALTSDGIQDVLDSLDMTSAQTVVLSARQGRPQPDAENVTSRFATAIAEALRGRADADRDLIVTPDELFAFLETSGLEPLQRVAQ